jgi:hypothetical protein
MRNTVHLVSARDALGWRPLFRPLLGAGFRAGLDGVDLERLAGLSRELLEQQPRTRAELGHLLGPHWPTANPASLAYAATHATALCQVPPRGVWGRTGPAAWAPVESWLGAPFDPVPVDELVLRYLGAFGPASVADMQAWSGLSRLREVAERLPLRTFRIETGPILYDLPDAPRPSADTPAPPRFLPAYDNLLLSYKDRSRVNPDSRPVPLPPGHGDAAGTFLIDGVWQGTWQVRDRSLRLEPFGPLPDDLLTEAARLADFLGVECENP